MTDSIFCTATPSSTHAIVYSGWGNYHVYRASVDVARQLLTEVLDQGGHIPGKSILDDRLRAKNNPQDLALIPVVVSAEFIDKVFKEALSGPEAQPSTRMALAMHAEPEKGQTALISKEQQKELILWAFEQQLDLKKQCGPDDLNRTHPELTLSFLGGVLERARGRPIRFEYESEIQSARELHQLLHGSWKPEAKPHNVVQRYLSYINEMTHRDERYELGELCGFDA